MSIWHYVWPWSQEHKERAAKAREVDERFQKQLEEAELRQESLKAAVEKIREDRQNRQTRAPLHSHPILTPFNGWPTT